MFKRVLAFSVAVIAHATSIASPYETWVSIVKSVEFQTYAAGYAEGSYGSVCRMESDDQQDGTTYQTTYFAPSEIENFNCQLLVAQLSPPVSKRLTNTFSTLKDQYCSAGHPLEAFSSMILSSQFSNHLQSAKHEGYAALTSLIAQIPDPRTPTLKAYRALVRQQDAVENAKCASFYITMESTPTQRTPWSVYSITPLVLVGARC